MPGKIALACIALLLAGCAGAPPQPEPTAAAPGDAAPERPAAPPAASEAPTPSPPRAAKPSPPPAATPRAEAKFDGPSATVGPRP
ncbi:MAG: hypothetical protein ABR570_18135, partial [Burkholderiales bacterium]